MRDPNPNAPADDGDPPTTTTSRGEDLRLQGNAAFGIKDYERALLLYQQSIDASQCNVSISSSSATSQDNASTAKTYGNIAATLCHLGRYPEAREAAEQATRFDAEWAKGWWRRGVVAQHTRDWQDAYEFFSKAVALDPDPTIFRKAQRDAARRLENTTLKTVKGPDGKEYAVAGIGDDDSGNSQDNNPAIKAWVRVHTTLGGSYYSLSDRYAKKQTPNSIPTSQQYLFEGTQQWVCGMKGSIAQLALLMSPDVEMEWIKLRKQQRTLTTLTSRDAFYLRAEQLLGGFPTGTELADLALGLTRLGGAHCTLEYGDLCPPPPSLAGPQFHGYQRLAFLRAIDASLQKLFAEHGFDGAKFKCSQAVIVASRTFYANIGMACPYGIEDLQQNPSPEDIVQYMKDELEKGGKTWKQMKPYMATMVYGTILWSFYIRVVQQEVAQAYELEQWVNQLLTLADEAFHVTRDEAFAEKGEVFHCNLRVGLLMVELCSVEALPGPPDLSKGSVSMERKLEVCAKILKLAYTYEESQKSSTKRSDYHKIQDDVAYRRISLVKAHSTIAASFVALKKAFDESTVQCIASKYSFIGDIDEEEWDPFALIAYHYEMAAENSLPDDAFSSLWWWAYASNMALASVKIGYTVGEFRRAIQKAVETEQQRDTYLHGENPLRGAGFETLVDLTALHLEDKADDDILPQVTLNREGIRGTPSYKAHLLIGEKIICPKFELYEQRQLQLEDGYSKRCKKLNLNATTVKHEIGESIGPNLTDAQNPTRSTTPQPRSQNEKRIELSYC